MELGSQGVQEPFTKEVFCAQVLRASKSSIFNRQTGGIRTPFVNTASPRSAFGSQEADRVFRGFHAPRLSRLALFASQKLLRMKLVFHDMPHNTALEEVEVFRFRLQDCYGICRIGFIESQDLT